jgi:alpha-amylase/alpha-mannosidase (GH57 family)
VKENDQKVYLLFVWHMHQPDYYDPEYQECVLPWVRLHGCKGYSDMPFYLADHPGVKATFNFSGTLLRELRGLPSDDRPDRYRNLTRKDPGELTFEEKIYILKHFFSLAPQRIKSSARLRELLGKRGRNISDSSMPELIVRFSDEDFMDLQVLFNLMWFGDCALATHDRLNDLIRKGRGFSAEDKADMLRLQGDVASSALGRYVEMESAGRIEVSFTPFHHPILPLLLDSASAAEGLPGVPLPERFSFPDDARWHVEEARKAYRDVFGKDPLGMWPAEGSVSSGVLDLLQHLDVRWIGTDEGVLWRSLRSSLPGSVGREELLYRPYWLSPRPTAVFFREHYLSDRIGFTYQSMDADAAVDDFISYMRQVAGRRSDGPPVVTVILDGENPWPYYPDGGSTFLRTLYTRLEKETWIETTTPSRVLEENVPRGELGYLFPGSWIDSNFHIWIGDHAKNRAWSLLDMTRRAVEASDCEPGKVERAMDHIRAAEGSDWFWWYGEPNSSTEDPIFDQLFRSRLRSALREVGGEVPVALLKPPGTTTVPAPVVRSPLTFIHPGVDGIGQTFFEWYNAGKYDVSRASGEMTTAAPLFSTVFYGFDYDFIYIRMDPLATPSRAVVERLVRVSVRVVVDEEREKWIEIALPSPVTFKVSGAAGSGEGLQVAFARILEVAVPFGLFGLERGSKINMNILVTQNDLLVERYPRDGNFEIPVPDEDWDNYQWIV